MRIYVACDLEGTAGVVDHRQQCWFDGKYYEQARRLAAMELNALVEGALEGGATEIWAWDGHGNFPGGLDVEMLHPECNLVMMAGDGGPAGLDGSFDAVFQLRLHAQVGAERGVLKHSFWGSIDGCWVNDQEIGEIAMICHRAGSYGVPVVFLAGDRAACEEIAMLITGVETVAVKEALWMKAEPAEREIGVASAVTVSLAPGKAREAIRLGARRAMAQIGTLTPFQLAAPYRLRTRYKDTRLADRSATRPGMKRIDGATVEFEQSEPGAALDLPL